MVQKTYKFGYSLRLEIITLILILLCFYGLADFLSTLIHPFLTLLLLGFYFPVLLFITMIVCLVRIWKKLVQNASSLTTRLQKKVRYGIATGLIILAVGGFVFPPDWWQGIACAMWIRYKNIDADSIRTWAQTVEYPNTQNYIDYYPKNMPAILKQYHPRYALVNGTGSERIISFSWGGGFIGGWGVHIEPKHATIAPITYKTNPCTLELKIAPGVFVFFYEG